MNKEIVSFNSGEMTPETDALSNIEKYAAGCRHLENMIPKIYGDAERRPGTKIPGRNGLSLEHAMYYYPYYAMTYISENAYIWGIPLNPITYTTLTLDTGGVNVSYSGGTKVGLPCAGHPFTSGQKIRINGTDNHNGFFDVEAETTANQIVITDTYVNETFNGDETVVRYITMTAGVGSMTCDSDGNLYVGHNRTGDPDYAVVKIEVDGTEVTDFITPDGGWPESGAETVIDLKVSNDGLYLYVHYRYIPGATTYPYMYKFRLSDGAMIWVNSDAGAAFSGNGGFALDADDNMYALKCGGDAWPGEDTLAKYLSDNGIRGSWTGMDNGNAVWADSNIDSGIVLIGGANYIKLTDINNLSVTTTVLAGTVKKNCIITSGDYIYALVSHATTGAGAILYKLDSDLAIVDSSIGDTDFPAYAVGLTIDPLGHIMIVNQRYSEGRNDIFYWYDTDLTYLGKTTEDFYNSMLYMWELQNYTRGDICFPLIPQITG